MCTSGDQLKVLLAKCARYLHQILFVRTSQFNLYTSICSYKMGVKYDIDFRTTVLASLSKRGDNGHQLLSANSMLQMAGRAGRRGIDELGHTVVVQSPFEGAEDCCKLLFAGPDPLVSQFTATYGMALNLLAVRASF
jgi:superfamily II RNA helicase